MLPITFSFSHPALLCTLVTLMHDVIGGGDESAVVLLENPVSANKISYDNLVDQCGVLFCQRDKKIRVWSDADMTTGRWSYGFN